MIDAKEVAKMLGVSRMTIYRMAESREISAIKVGRVWRFIPKQIEDYIKKNTH